MIAHEHIHHVICIGVVITRTNLLAIRQRIPVLCILIPLYALCLQIGECMNAISSHYCRILCKHGIAHITLRRHIELS